MEPARPSIHVVLWMFRAEFTFLFQSEGFFYLLVYGSAFFHPLLKSQVSLPDFKMFNK
jgi:hypothetical protein